MLNALYGRHRRYKYALLCDIVGVKRRLRGESLRPRPGTHGVDGIVSVLASVCRRGDRLMYLFVG